MLRPVEPLAESFRGILKTEVPRDCCWTWERLDFFFLTTGAFSVPLVRTGGGAAWGVIACFGGGVDFIAGVAGGGAVTGGGVGALGAGIGLGAGNGSGSGRLGALGAPPHISQLAIGYG